MKSIPKKSRAAAIVQYNKPFEIREFSVPEIVPGAILVKIEMAGICGTDVHQWRGELGVKPKLPVIPGHEAIGRIIEIGEGRTRDCSGTPLKIGDRIMWTHISCGECVFCTDFNQPNLCEHRVSYGMSCADDYPYITGAFSEYVYLLPKADVIKVPDKLTNEEVIGVCCAFRTVVAAFERLDGSRDQNSVVILGSGPIGLYSTLLAVEGGASTTIVVGAPSLRLDLAKKFGANHTINIEEQDFNKRKKQILELTNGKGPDIVVEASGAPIAFREGMETVRRGGRFLIIGQSSAEAEQSIIPGLIMIKHLQIIGNCSATIRHYHKAIQFIMNKRDKYPFGRMVSNKYSLDQINSAIKAMAAGKEIKPVIIP